jgi:cell division control protein 45
LWASPARPSLATCGRSESKSPSWPEGIALIHRSKFGLAFQQAADESGAGAKHDMFDTSVVEVRAEDLTGFIECLQLQSA